MRTARSQLTPSLVVGLAAVLAALWAGALVAESASSGEATMSQPEGLVAPLPPLPAGAAIQEPLPAPDPPAPAEPADKAGHSKLDLPAGGDLLPPEAQPACQEGSCSSNAQCEALCEGGECERPNGGCGHCVC